MAEAGGGCVGGAGSQGAGLGGGVRDAGEEEPGAGAAGQAGVGLPLGPNLDGLWPERPERGHQAPQGCLHGGRAAGAVPRGVHQEHHVHQAPGTGCGSGRSPRRSGLRPRPRPLPRGRRTWAVRDRGRGTLDSLLDGRQGEDVGRARRQAGHLLGARGAGQRLRGPGHFCRGRHWAQRQPRGRGGALPAPQALASPHLGPRVASTTGCSWRRRALGSRPG